MKSILNNLFFFIVTMLLLASCTKEPGVGGSAIVTGKIYAKIIMHLEHLLVSIMLRIIKYILYMEMKPEHLMMM